MNSNPLPPITPSDLQGILALAAFCKDPDAVAAAAADLAAQQAKITDLIRQSEALNAEQADLAGQIADKQAALDIAIDAHKARHKADEKNLSDLANSLNLKAADLTDQSERQTQTAADQGAKATSLAAMEADLNARAATLAADRKAFDVKLADLNRRLALVQQAQA